MTKSYQRLRLILGDQLNASHSWFKDKDPDTLYLIAELQQETNYVVHHVQKICAFFAAMQQFAQALNNADFNVVHLTLDDTQSFVDLPSLLEHFIAQHQIQQFEYQLPDEYRLRQQLADFTAQLSIHSQSYSTEHFYLTEQELHKNFSAGKPHRMEAFYRKMRKNLHILMDAEGNPEGGQWNYDADNRNKLKASDLACVPQPLLFSNDVSEILARLERHQIKTMGRAATSLLWPVNRQQAKELLDYFCRYGLPRFGQFQDAMTCQLNQLEGDNQWSLYHSRLSFALNSKIISPKLVVDKVIAHYRAQQQQLPSGEPQINLAQVEGFIRQILGWREFVRGIYWANMPEYASRNALSATRSLPSWFWTGTTQMNCMKHAIEQSLDYAYAHHIQRLMITGNFCLLAGIDPDEVDAWYLGVYIDALEWVEMPNTRGMSQFADGGIVGSKAYAASGNYVKKMSDYCGSCHYQVAKTTEADACPLNSLYWRFIHQQQQLLGNNPRNAMVYANWQKKIAEQQQAILTRAELYLNAIEQL